MNNYKIYMGAVITALLFVACNLTPDRQSAVDEIKKLREQTAVELEEATEQWAALKSEMGAIEIRIQEAIATGDTALAEALGDQKEFVTQSLAHVAGQQDELAESIDDLDSMEDKIRAEQGGETTQQILLLLGSFLGGGAGGGLLSKLTPSRAQGAVTDVQKELAAIKASLEAYQKSGGAVAPGVAKVDEDLRKMHELLDAFSKGLNKQGGSGDQPS